MEESIKFSEIKWIITNVRLYKHYETNLTPIS